MISDTSGPVIVSAHLHFTPNQREGGAGGFTRNYVTNVPVRYACSLLTTYPTRGLCIFRCPVDGMYCPIYFDRGSELPEWCVGKTIEWRTDLKTPHITRHICRIPTRSDKFRLCLQTNGKLIF